MAGGRWDGGGAHHCLLYWLLSLGVQSRVQHNSRCFSGRWLLCFRLSSWSLFRFSLWLFVLKVREKRFNIWIHSITEHQTIKILLIILQASSFIKIVLEKSFIHLASWAFTELESLEMDSIIFFYHPQGLSFPLKSGQDLPFWLFIFIICNFLTICFLMTSIRDVEIQVLYVT